MRSKLLVGCAQALLTGIVMWHNRIVAQAEDSLTSLTMGRKSESMVMSVSFSGVLCRAQESSGTRNKQQQRHQLSVGT